MPCRECNVNNSFDGNWFYFKIHPAKSHCCFSGPKTFHPKNPGGWNLVFFNLKAMKRSYGPWTPSWPPPPIFGGELLIGIIRFGLPCPCMLAIALNQTINSRKFSVDVSFKHLHNLLHYSFFVGSIRTKHIDTTFILCWILIFAMNIEIHAILFCMMNIKKIEFFFTVSHWIAINNSGNK